VKINKIINKTKVNKIMMVPGRHLDKTKDRSTSKATNKDKVINKVVEEVVVLKKEEEVVEDEKEVEKEVEKEAEKEEEVAEAVVGVVHVAHAVKASLLDMTKIKIASLIKEAKTSLGNNASVVGNTIENLENSLRTFLTIMSQISQKSNKNLKIGINNSILLHLPTVVTLGLALLMIMLL
jgi:cation transport regulator ChaC